MKAVGYKKSLPVDAADALIDFETAKPEPKGRDIRVAVRAISANPVDYKVRKRAAPPEGETKILGYDAAGIVDVVGADVTLFKPGDEVFYAGSILRQGTNSEFHLVDERIVGRKPTDAVVRAGRRPSAHLDHRLGTAVRPARCRARQKRRSAHAVDRRRRRRRRLDPDPACAPPHRPDRRGHGVPAGIAKVVPRSRRPCRRRSRKADEGADRETESPAGRPGRKPHQHRPALQGDGGADGAAGKIRTDRRSPGIQRQCLQGQGDLDPLGIDVHALVVPDVRHDRPAQSAQRRRRPHRQGRAAHHARPELWHHQRRQPQARACAAGDPASRAARSCWRGGRRLVRRNQAAAGSLPRISDRADNSRSICPSVPTVIRR